MLGTKIDPHSLTREQQAHFIVSDEQDAYGAKLQRIAAGYSSPCRECVSITEMNGNARAAQPSIAGPTARDGYAEYYKKLALLWRAIRMPLKPEIVHSMNRAMMCLAFCAIASTDGMHSGTLAQDGMYLGLSTGGKNRIILRWTCSPVKS